MKTQKLGVLYANKLVRTGGYVSEEEIIGAYAEVYGSTKASKITENKLIIREISQESCAEIYKDLNKEKVEHILVLGDDASIIFNYFYENLLDPQKKIPWTSVLASFQFNKNVPKIWMSQEMEIATVVNFIRKQKEKDHNFKVVIVSTSETSNFTKYFHEKVKRVLERFDIKLSDRIDDADTIIVIGLGDSAHAQKINWLSTYKNKLIVTNSAILEVIDKLGTTVYSTYIYRPNLASVTFNTYKYDSVRIKLPELFLKIAFYMTSINPDKGFFYNEYSNYPLYYDEEKYIHIPVEIVEVNRNHQLKYKTENYKNYVTSLEQLSYSITGGTGVDDDMFGSYGILEVSCIFNYNQHFLVESQNQYGDQSIRNHDFQVYNDIVKSIFRIDNNSLFPIQINLEDEDVNDNVTYRLCMKIDNIRRYPIVIPTDFKNKEINICLVPNLTCDLQNEICVDIGNLQNFIGEINYCRSNFNYVYILPYVEDQNKYGYTFIGSRKKLSSIHLHLWQLKLTPIVSKLHVECISKTILKESLKSAVSAIMTRNMSHNLGSHYLYYTKMQLEQLAKESGKYGPDIRGAAKVMGYMQGRMDYLATLISGERYPYGCVNFKSQIYDELTIDDFSKRHFKKKYARNRTTNFLLSNLIWSEGFTRSNIIDGIDTENSINVHIRYNNSIFTGSAQRKIANREDDVKRKLSEINIALPGGIMSCHAFFNIIENFIRNSAKYHQQDFQNKNLTTTIKISETRENNLDVYEFIIYDNKHNAYSKEYIEKKESNLITSIRNRLSSLRILDDNNAVEKSNKGFKEMLFSAIWMRSFVFMQDEDKNAPSNYSEVLAAIQSAPEGNEKLQLIEKYGFSIIAVNDEGEKCSESNETANLALRFTLPKFKKQFEVSLFSNDAYDAKLATSRLLNVYGEVVCVNQTSFDQLIKELNKKANSASSIDKGLVIPRMVTTDQKFESDVEALKYVLDKRFGQDFDLYKISIENIKENRQKVKEPYKIYFQTHLSTKADINDFKDHAYADSISGGNFTLTLSEIFNRWKEKDWDKNAPEYYEVLKIKESALTRITLIDERLYNEMLNKDNGVELACKNIRVLNYSEPSIDDTSEKSPNSLMKLFKGNEFNSGDNSTHFLSIHLGIIEKIIKNSNAFNSMRDESGKEYGEYSEQERTIIFINLLKKYFGDKNQKVFISIHSGRGNYSAELNGPLSTYPFISMSAIEIAYNNSKYLLSQLFYSTIYLGKGIVNN